MMDNFETLNENYGMDTNLEQFSMQNFYHLFVQMTEDGNSLWRKVDLDKKRIVWKNPMNGFTIAALQDVNFEIRLPNFLSSYEENFNVFKSLWTNLDYDLDLLYQNVESHRRNDEYCCLHCHFPFDTVCAELYTQFKPDPPS